MAQVLLMIFITYFPFYTANGNGCWDKTGIYLHSIATFFIFFMLPLVTAGVAIYSIVEDVENYYRPHTSIHMVILVCKLCDIIIGIVGVRPIVKRSWTWHTIQKAEGKSDQDNGVAYKNIVHGWGEGTSSLGEALEIE